MAHGTLYARRCGAVTARDLRIEYLRHRIDHVYVLHRNDDRLAHILVALDVRRYADLVDHRRDLAFK